MILPRRLRVLAGCCAVPLLGGLLLFASCSSSGGGGTRPPDGGNDEGTGGFPITGESFTLDLGGGAVFDLTSGGEAVRNAFAVQLFTETPTDSPSNCTLLLDAQDVRMSGAETAQTQSITVAAYIGDADSTNPCDDGANIGSFTVSYDGATVSLGTGELSLSGTALSYVSSGSFTLCLSASADADATMEIVSMSLRFASSAEPGPGADDGTEPGPGTDDDGATGPPPEWDDIEGPPPVDFAVEEGTQVTELIPVAAGGTVTAIGSAMVTLEIPPGALPADTDVSVTVVSDPADSPYTLMVMFEPDGLELTEPATLVITLDPPVPPGGDLNLVEVASTDLDALIDTGFIAEVSDDGSTVRISVEHFSAVGCRLNCHGQSVRRIVEALTRPVSEGGRGLTKEQVIAQIDAAVGDQLATSSQSRESALRDLEEHFDPQSTERCWATPRELQAYLNTFYTLSTVRLNAQYDEKGQLVGIDQISQQCMKKLADLTKSPDLPPILNLGRGFTVGGQSDTGVSPDSGPVFFDHIPHSAPIIADGDHVQIDQGAVLSKPQANALQNARESAAAENPDWARWWDRDIPQPGVVPVNLFDLDRFRRQRGGAALQEAFRFWGADENLVKVSTRSPWAAIRIWVPKGVPTDFCEGDDDSVSVEPGYQVFRITNYGSQRDGYLTVLPTSAVNDPPLLSSYPGGGLDPQLTADLAALDGRVFETREEAARSICSGFKRFYRPALASFILAAEWNGQSVGVDGVFQDVWTGSQ